MCTVGNFSKQLVQCFLVLPSCSWLRWCCAVCRHCDSCDSLPGHFCSGGPICISQEPSRLWVWYYWLLGTQWRLSAREHQGSETRSVDIALHTCDVCVSAASLGGVRISDLQVMSFGSNISSMKTWIWVCFIHYSVDLIPITNHRWQDAQIFFFFLNRFLCHTFKCSP